MAETKARFRFAGFMLVVGCGLLERTAFRNRHEIGFLAGHGFFSASCEEPKQNLISLRKVFSELEVFWLCWGCVPSTRVRFGGIVEPQNILEQL